MNRKPVPSYLLHRASGQAFVRVTEAGGARRVVYLGRHGSEESRRAYERLLADLRARGCDTVVAVAAGASASTIVALTAMGREATVLEALAAYAPHLEAYYPGDSARGHRDALKPVREIAGDLLLREFTPRILKAVRQRMIDAGQSRTTINSRVGKIVQWAKWCVAEELAEPGLHAALTALSGLRKGRGEAVERAPVRAPAEEEIERVIAKLPAAAADLVRVQMVCGARAGELVGLRGDDLDRGDGGAAAVWRAVVRGHKGKWRGDADRPRVLYFGPRCRAVLAPLALKAAGGPLFVNGRGRTYRVNGYRQALQRGCAAAGVAEFGTHAMRHFAATRLRRMVDVEAARVLLGHSDLSLTAAVYAERDEVRIVEVVGRVG